MYKVLLQNTFQSSMPLLNAFFGLSCFQLVCQLRKYETYTILKTRKEQQSGRFLDKDRVDCKAELAGRSVWEKVPRQGSLQKT